jgi:hypothetical protein
LITIRWQTSANFRSTGTWIDNTHFVTNTYQGNGTGSDNIRLYKFNPNGTLTYGSSITFVSGRNWPPIVAEINAAASSGAATWTGTLQDGTTSARGALTPYQQQQQINYLQTNVDYQLQELFKAPGTSAESLELNYYATMMTGILVAMLGTTVLFYTFKNI